LFRFGDVVFFFGGGGGWVILKINIFISCKGTFMLTTTYEKKKNPRTFSESEKSMLQRKKKYHAHTSYTSLEKLIPSA